MTSDNERDGTLPDGRVTRAQADAMRLANVLAWTFLTDGQDPPSQRRASESPEVLSPVSTAD